MKTLAAIAGQAFQVFSSIVLKTPESPVWHGIDILLQIASNLAIKLLI